MTGPCLDLFAYSVERVTVEDVIAYAPNDPGYANYVRAFTRIIEGREMPSKAAFDITETIGLTQWVDADREANPLRFRRFRVLTNSIGMTFFLDGLHDAVGALQGMSGRSSILYAGPIAGWHPTGFSGG